jgi:hypothetical protein
MKTWKQNIFGIVAIIAMTFAFIALSLTGCDPNSEDTTDNPKDQTATIHPFEDLTLTVKGHFKNSEWTGVPNKIETAISNRYETTPEAGQSAFKVRYAKCETIFVEKTSEYTNWKTNGDGKTIYINFGILDNTDLPSLINYAIGSMSTNGKAKDGVPYGAVCNCPNGTLHLVGETCCEGVDCECEKNVVGQRVEGIAITNRQNVTADVFNDIVTKFTTAFIHTLISDTQRAWLKTNLKEVKVVPSGVTGSMLNGVLTVEEGTGASGIRATLIEWMAEQTPPVN